MIVLGKYCLRFQVQGETEHSRTLYCVFYKHCTAWCQAMPRMTSILSLPPFYFTGSSKIYRKEEIPDLLLNLRVLQYSTAVKNHY